MTASGHVVGKESYVNLSCLAAIRRLCKLRLVGRTYVEELLRSDKMRQTDSSLSSIILSVQDTST